MLEPIFKPIRPPSEFNFRPPATKKGDFTGIANQVLRDKDIMREFMLSKKFPFSPDKNVLSGEDAIPLARKAKFDEETKQMGISLTPGKDAKNTVDEFVNQMKRFKVSDKDIQSMLKSGKSGQVDYVMEQYGLSAGDVADILKRGKPLIEGMESGGRVGLKGGTTALKAILNFFAKESGKKGSQGLQSINPKSVDSSILNIMGPEHKKLLQTNRKEYLENLLDVIKSDKKLLDDIKTKYPEDVQPMIYKMVNEGGNKGRLDVYKNIDINEAITDVETMVKNMELAGGRKLNSDGGRVGLKGGSMSKRAFLKMLAALGITGAAAKSGIVSLGGKQTGKQVVKEIVKTPNVAGKPEWFDTLVNKVIAEGVDKTDDLAYKERMVVHTKKINPNEEIAVYQDLDDGSVRINVGGHMTDKDGNVIRAVNDPDQVDLIVRQGKTEEGGFKTKDSFEASEAEPRVSNQDGDIEFDGENVVNNVDDLMKDVSSLEEYATGKKLVGDKAKKALEKQKKFEKFTENQVEQAEYIENKYGPGGDYASGGIARMLGE